MRKFLALLSAAVGLMSFPAAAGNYAECMKLVDMAPKRAYELAAQWRDYSGGIPAEHCMALSLFAQGEYEKAAAMLEDLAQRAQQQAKAPSQQGPAVVKLGTDGKPETHPELLPPGLAIDLLAQAGNAWLMTENNEKAFTVLSEALGMQGINDDQAAEILIDRARTRVEMGNLEGAVKDLDDALLRGGPRSEAYSYRAAAHRALGHFESARADIDKALMLDAENADALLERANLNHAIGNSEAAIIDWIQVMKLAPDTLSAKAAADSVNKVRAQQAEEEKAPPKPSTPALHRAEIPKPAAPSEAPPPAPAPAP
ncbi:tetratricopeptide repeat protein [Emcibacter sp. SYSU 3D8]|uniref:tetratricopeptide repeat protein n=1 Tax=Emcibacter sp. SYSU 3D8 TaxID=3133969 RepID=UPI0031FED437